MDKKNFSENSKAYTFNKQGEDFVLNGQPEKKAIEAFEKKSLEAGYEESAIYSNLCWAYNEMGQFEKKGLEYIEKAYQLKSIDAGQSINYGNSYYGLARYEEAIEKKYEFAIKIDEYYSSLYYGMLGSAYMAINDYDKAIENFEAYLVHEPGDVDAKLELVKCHMGQDELVKAYNIVEQVVVDHYDNFEAHDLKGYIMEFLEERERVESFYGEIKVKFPDSLEAWVNIGIYYYELGLYHEAVAVFKEVYEKFPDESLVNVWLSSSLSKTGDVEESIQNAQAAIDVEPTAINYNNMGNILLDQTQYLEAIPYYEKAYNAMDTVEATYSINILYAYILAKRYQKKAIDYGLTVIDEMINSYEIPEMMAYAYQMKNEYKSAIDYLNIAKKRKLDESKAAYYLAENYYLLGDYQAAEDYINECLDYNLDDYKAIELKERIDLLQSGSQHIVQSIMDDYYLYSSISEDSKKNEASKSNSQDIEDLSYEETKKTILFLR